MLRAAGVRFVLDDADDHPPQVAVRLPGSVVIITLPGLTVYRIPGLAVSAAEMSETC